MSYFYFLIGKNNQVKLAFFVYFDYEKGTTFWTIQNRQYLFVKKKSRLVFGLMSMLYVLLKYVPTLFCLSKYNLKIICQFYVVKLTFIAELCRLSYKIILVSCDLLPITHKAFPLWAWIYRDLCRFIIKSWKWYFATKIILTYCEKKSRLKAENLQFFFWDH